jgi:hypothetical protein
VGSTVTSYWPSSYLYAYVLMVSRLFVAFSHFKKLRSHRIVIGPVPRIQLSRSPASIPIEWLYRFPVKWPLYLTGVSDSFAYGKTYEQKKQGSLLMRLRTHFAWVGLFLVLLLSLVSTRTNASPANAESPQTTSDEHDGQHDFDFIFGRWKIHLKRKVAASNTWTEFDGIGVYRKVWGGRANLNEFEADSPTGHLEGLTLRTYNPHTHQWSLYWGNSNDGVLDTPQIGGFKNGRGEFYAEDTSDGRSTFVRYVWTIVAANSVHFEQSLSGDGGNTWDTNWVSDMERIADSDQPPTTTETNSTTGKTDAESDGQHDFDPLLGSWKFRLRRRIHPLTGSTTWVDLSGTGVCYKVWNGRAQLDTVELDGPTGHIEGLTLRLFNPQTHQWRLYWANSKDGTVVVPQIGQFKNGHGEFYAQDDLDRKIIFVRFDWTNLGTSSPHFEQSFSNDGGKTWEVNWITDQTRISESSSK